MVAPGSAEHFDEPPSEKLAWLRLREITDIRERGLSLFEGNEAHYGEFRNFVRQGRAYWDAGASTRGSASALLYYYAMMNLAKAELMLFVPDDVPRIHHGIGRSAGRLASVRSDSLRVSDGVFPLLYQKRTGTEWPKGLKIQIPDLFSLIPEIGYEMNVFGRTRAPSMRGYRAIVADGESAWGFVGFRTEGLPLDSSEPVIQLLLSASEQIELGGMKEWRNILGLSTRFAGADLVAFQSLTTFSSETPDGVRSPDYASAGTEFSLLMGQHLSVPVTIQAEFMLTPSLQKSDAFVLPLSLARYAAMFYLSSLVRYQPSALDPEAEGAQAWLMDSFVTETPLPLLIGMVDAIVGKEGFYNYSYRA